MEKTSDIFFTTLSLTKNEKEAVSINIEHYIRNHIREGGAQQQNMAARQEIWTAADIESLISDQDSNQS